MNVKIGVIHLRLIIKFKNRKPLIIFSVINAKM